MLGTSLGHELSWCTEPSQLHVFFFFPFPISFNNHALSNPPSLLNEVFADLTDRSNF